MSFSFISIKISVIEKSNILNRKCLYSNIIEKYFLVSNKIKLKYTNLSSDYLLIEHNLKYDDILFLIPLYTIIIKTDIVVICDGSYDKGNYIYHYNQAKRLNYSLTNLVYYYYVT